MESYNLIYSLTIPLWPLCADGLWKSKGRWESRLEMIGDLDWADGGGKKWGQMWGTF